jgi:hypothetical protein
MPKRVLVPSLKVKRLIRLFDSSPSKMTKKSSTPAAATAVKSATALAHMAEELEKDEVAASRSAATAAPVDPVANTSSLDAMATAVSDIFIPVARKRSSDPPLPHDPPYWTDVLELLSAHRTSPATNR